MPLAFICFFKHKMAETKISKKKPFFCFVNNSCSYWQKPTKFHAKLDYTDLHNILKFFTVLLTSTIFPPTVPFDPVSRFTPVSPTTSIAVLIFVKKTKKKHLFILQSVLSMEKESKEKVLNIQWMKNYCQRLIRHFSFTK